MKIGFDVDGVIANFYDAYENITREVTGRDLFPRRGVEGVSIHPPTWNWPEHYGYTKAEMSAVWRAIKVSDWFWLSLQPLPDSALVRDLVHTKPHNIDLYFVTARPGATAKHQTDQWMRAALGMPVTVLISDQKGAIAKALGLDVYVDDKAENIIDTLEQSPSTRAYLVDRDYNRHIEPTERHPFLRVKDLRAMFLNEGLIGERSQEEAA